jgi:hypothetical protein
MIKHKIIFFTLLFAASDCFAFFCPNNFNQIELGYSLEQVQQQCGKPDKQEVKKIEDEGPQEWSYYIPQTVMMSNSQSAQGTLKTSIIFNDKDAAINISVNGIGVGNSTICGTPIQLGDSREAVKSACGKPAFINKQAAPGSAEPKSHTNTDLTYANTVLTFEDGKLTGKK